ncbi:MAG: 30S ribosomal protein S11 [Alphaproteobacteria bacterium]|nr:30S ribosomal protein S11 [Alphaproteobacteria bacterium]
MSTTPTTKKTKSKSAKKILVRGRVFIEATFNNTKIALTEEKGNVVAWSTSALLGFTSAKKATPYAAAKVAEAIIEKASAMGVKEIDIVIKGVGNGRESALRTFVNKGFVVLSIKDKTPIPHNGPKQKKPRRI